MNKRIEWIDELKGFVLLLVCIGHIHINSTIIGIVLACSTAFRMTTFFFLSGILFSTRKHNTLKSYYQSKKKCLLYPYICLSLLFILLDPRLYNTNYISFDNLITHQLYESCNLTLPINNSLKFLYLNLINIFIVGDSSTATGPLWFVLVLFIVCILFFIINRIAKGNNLIISTYAIICLLLGWINNINIHSIELPFKLATIFTASFFFTLGHLSKNYLHLLTEIRGGGGSILVLTIITTLIPYMYFINQNGGISLWSNALGPNLLFFILSTLTGIFLIINIFILFDKSTNKLSIVVKGILRNIARNALIILAVHYWTIRCCNIFLHTYKNTVWYSFLVLVIVILTCILAIPLFRNKLYWLIGKKKISIKESLSIN